MRDAPAGTARALEEGARRSREASSPPAHEPFLDRVWRRHKWKIIGLLLFGLFDYILLGGGHFGRSP